MGAGANIAGQAQAAVSGGGYWGGGGADDPHGDGLAPGSMGRAYLYWWIASAVVLAVGFKIVDGY